MMIVVQVALQGLNISYLKQQGHMVPRAFAGVIDSALLEKTSRYTQAKASVSLYAEVLNQAIAIWFFFGGLLNWYNNWIMGMELAWLWSGVVFFLLLIYAQTLLGLPEKFIQTFKIENKFGFNTTTIKLWLSDLFKSLVIATILLTMVVSVALWLVHAFAQVWWLWVWGFFLLFSLFIMLISPYVIEPLFNQYTPIEDEALSARIKKMCRQAGIEVSRIFTMDASKRSRHSNAYFTGIGKVKRIVLFDTLLEQMSQDEVLAVLAHELGHWKKKHLLKRLLLSESIGLLTIYTAFHLVQSSQLINWFALEQPSLPAQIVILGLLGSMVMFPFAPLFNWLSRRDERAADEFAIWLKGESSSLRSALIKLSKENLANLHPHPWYAAVHYSHPPIVERLDYLEKSGQRNLAANIEIKEQTR